MEIRAVFMDRKTMYWILLNCPHYSKVSTDSIQFLSKMSLAFYTGLGKKNPKIPMDSWKTLNNEKKSWERTEIKTWYFMTSKPITELQ